MFFDDEATDMPAGDATEDTSTEEVTEVPAADEGADSAEAEAPAEM